MGLISGQGTKVPQAAWWDQKFGQKLAKCWREKQPWHPILSWLSRHLKKKGGGLLLINFRIQDSMVIIFSSIIYTSESSTYPAETEIKLSARNQMEYFIVLSQWQLHNVWTTFVSSMICGFGLAWKWKNNGTINLHYPNSPQSPIRVMKI